MKLQKINNSYLVLADNGKEIGTFELDWDGSYYYWVDDFSTGAWSSYILKEIARLLDEVNEPFDKQVNDYFTQEKKDFENRAKIEYRKLKNESKMMPLLYVHLTGDWNKDRIEWLEIYKELEDLRNELL